MGRCSRYLQYPLVLPAKHVLHSPGDEARVPGGGVGAGHHLVLLLGLLVGLCERPDGPRSAETGGDVGHAGVGAVEEAGVEFVQDDDEDGRSDRRFD